MEHEVFSSRLKMYIAKSGFSLHELSRRAGLNYLDVKDWVDNIKVPNRDQVLNLAATIKSSIDDTNTMLMTVGYLPLNDTEKENQISSINSNKPVKISAKDIIDTYATQKQIDVLLEETSKRLADLEESIKSNYETKNAKTQRDINSELSKLKDTVVEIEKASQKLSIPLDLPNSDELKVTLVPSTALGQLEEYRSEENKWFSICGVFLGAVLGLLTNWVSGSAMGDAAWALLIVFLVMAVFTGWTGYTYKIRGDKVKKKKLHMIDD